LPGERRSGPKAREAGQNRWLIFAEGRARYAGIFSVRPSFAKASEGTFAAKRRKWWS